MEKPVKAPPYTGPGIRGILQGGDRRPIPSNPLFPGPFQSTVLFSAPRREAFARAADPGRGDGIEVRPVL